MKTIMTSLLITTTIFTLCIMNVSAQDWMQKDSKSISLLADTTFVRAMQVTIMPGEKGSVHTHPAHFFYALTDGKIIVHYTDGKDEVYDLKAGDGGYSDPERPHWTENGGDTPIKFLLVELKEHPYRENLKK